MEAVNILYNRQKFGDGRQLRRAKSVLQTMFLDSDLKELAEGGVPIEEVNAMQKQRDEYNKTRLQQSESDASPWETDEQVNSWTYAERVVLCLVKGLPRGCFFTVDRHL